MKTIYLIRHAKSSWADWSLPDHDRPLNERGKRDAPFMAAKLREQGFRLDGLLTSTAKRARRTARAFRKAYAIDKSKEIRTQELYHANPDHIEAQIQKLPGAWNEVAVFGHNPGFTYLANRSQGAFIDNVPTCGITACRLDVDRWSDWSMTDAERLFFWYPKMWLR
ncbi:MAG: histidine phosphatase family protein [Bacteroidota bacterium]